MEEPYIPSLGGLRGDSDAGSRGGIEGAQMPGSLEREDSDT